MKTQRHLGLSFLRGRIQAAEIEHGKHVQLTGLAERDSTLDFSQVGAQLNATHPQLPTFVSELKELINENRFLAGIISYALPPDPVFINMIPADPSLKGPELNEYLQWEMEQYYPGTPAREFIIDFHALHTPKGSPKELFMVSVRRGMAGFIQKVTTDLKLKLNIIDIDQFSTEKTLLFNYPEVLDHPIVLCGVRFGFVDASLVHKGEMSDYRSFRSSSDSDVKKAIHQYLKYLKEKDVRETPAALLLHGADIPLSLILELRTETGIKQTLAINSCRKLPVSAKVSKPLLQESYRFAAAIGLALRSIE
jgi:Tfp pilus assembly PilM family ATPase